MAARVLDRCLRAREGARYRKQAINAGSGEQRNQEKPKPKQPVQFVTKIENRTERQPSTEVVHGKPVPFSRRKAPGFAFSHIQDVLFFWSSS
jgi:hypothetical protein